MNRFYTACDNGSGKGCYDYARSLWNRSQGQDRKNYKKYLLRGCQLAYQPACQASKSHSVSRQRWSRRAHVKQSQSEECFNTKTLEQATFTSNRPSPSILKGNFITQIRPNSFWSKVGLEEGDLITRVNNMPFNTTQEIMQVFASAGKNFAFEVERKNGVTTLWYRCGEQTSAP